MAESWTNKKFTPALLYFKGDGHLPEYPETITSYDLPADLPKEAKSVLLYTYLTTHNEGLFQRGYYTFYTQETIDGKTIQYNMYMNFTTGLGVSMNSNNIWLPVTSEKKLHIKLQFEDSSAKAKKKSIAYKEGLVKGCRFRGEWSQIFVTGYNV